MDDKSSLLDSKHLQIEALVIQVMSTYKTRVSQLTALKQTLSLYFDDDEANKIAIQKMKEFNPNTQSGKHTPVVFIEQIDKQTVKETIVNNTLGQRKFIALSGPTLLLHTVNETIAFIDDWNFDANAYKNIFIPKITYYTQLTGWTCGPACIRMILATLINEKATEKQLIKLLNTNPTDGTLQKGMISIGDHSKYKNVLEYQYSDYGSLTRLAELTKNGWLCILEWSLDDCPHFAIFSHDDNKCIYLKDPFFGKLYPVEKFDFIGRWNVYKCNYLYCNFVLRDRESCRWYLAFRVKNNK